MNGPKIKYCYRDELTEDDKIIVKNFERRVNKVLELVNISSIVKQISIEIPNLYATGKQIGKVIKTDNYINRCECGKMVSMQAHVKMPDSVSLHELKMKDDFDRWLGICECGNIFVSE